MTKRSERVRGDRGSRLAWVGAVAAISALGACAIAVIQRRGGASAPGEGGSGARGALSRCDGVEGWSEAHGRCVARDEHGFWERMAVGGTQVTFRWIGPGTFTMGSPPTEEGRLENEGPQHQVELTRGFWLGETEVTQAQWRAVMGNNPSDFNGDDRPVEQVSWEDVQGFLQRVNRGGGAFRLPTEAEWEFAARAGSTGARHGALDEVAWHRENSGGQTHPVGQKAANAWGLRDMLGNEWEWCADLRGAYAAGRAVDPTGPSTGSLRVFRGGSWFNDALAARAASRGHAPPSEQGPGVGFRLARGQ